MIFLYVFTGMYIFRQTEDMYSNSVTSNGLGIETKNSKQTETEIM